MQITAKVKACEIRQDGTLLKLSPFDKDISAEGKGSIMIPDGIYAVPGSLVEIEITILQPLQLVLFRETEHLSAVPPAQAGVAG